ncbi:aldo/keto reductase [Devosia sp. WQ 349]|uniref:aldo/keto reductase n=1 Tax=Devosia sp. WQ 349K1 TaxID=2800329 RepID=UPI001907AC2B|nr:aldo/keto reductase [Devosia sp. WQ 349K1]MBK1793278.1 aldo/keto reductase [Devosia sp. WQ 349K1]
MKYRYLGQSGLLVSRLCLGTMTFGNKQWGCDQEASTAIVRAFVEGGGNFIDTADGYSGGDSERMLGVALKDFVRDDLVVATKCWFPTNSAVTSRGLSRKHIIEACEKSLKRMGLDYIDLYQFHGPDPYTPIEESMRAAEDLVRSGKVCYLGCSNFYGWQISKANTLAEAKGYEKLISAQHLYNLIRRDVEREILPACEDAGVGMICWSPLAAGMLSGKYQGKDKPDADTRMGIQASIALPRYWFDDALKAIDVLVAVAKQLGKTPSQVALSWLLGNHQVTAAIIGARKVEQVAENLHAGDFNLPDEIQRQLTEAMPLKLGYPFEWTDNNLRATFGKAEFEPKHTVHLP